MAIASPPQTVPTKRMGWQAGGRAVLRTAKHPKAMRKCSSQGALGTAHAVFPDGIQLLFALEIQFLRKHLKTIQNPAAHGTTATFPGEPSYALSSFLLTSPWKASFAMRCYMAALAALACSALGRFYFATKIVSAKRTLVHWWIVSWIVLWLVLSLPYSQGFKK